MSWSDSFLLVSNVFLRTKLTRTLLLYIRSKRQFRFRLFLRLNMKGDDYMDISNHVIISHSHGGLIFIFEIKFLVLVEEYVLMKLWKYCNLCVIDSTPNSKDIELNIMLMNYDYCLNTRRTFVLHHNHFFFFRHIFSWHLYDYIEYDKTCNSFQFGINCEKEANIFFISFSGHSRLGLRGYGGWSDSVVSI